MKVKFTASGTWVASGAFEFWVIAGQAVFATESGNRACLRASAEAATGESVLLPETAVHQEMFKKSLGEVSSNAERQDCHPQYNL